MHSLSKMDDAGMVRLKPRGRQGWTTVVWSPEDCGKMKGYDPRLGVQNGMLTFTFTFSHLADALIQSDLQ